MNDMKLVQGMIKARRLGRFHLRADDMQDNPQAMLALMGSCLVVDCRWEPDTGCFSYTAYSTYFEPVQIGHRAPEYKPLVGARGRGRFLGFARKHHLVAHPHAGEPADGEDGQPVG